MIEDTPGFAGADDKTKEALRRLWPEVEAMAQATFDDVKAHLAGAKLVEFPRGNHYLFITERAKVLAETRAVIGSP